MEEPNAYAFQGKALTIDIIENKLKFGYFCRG